MYIKKNDSITIVDNNNFLNKFVAKKAVFASEILFGGNDSELAFEVDDMDGFVSKLRSFGVTYVHPMKEHSWGQRVVRFYDPDKHVIEVGENMAVVVKRFIDSGLTAEETAKRMDIPMEYVNYLLTKQNNN